MKRLMTPFCHGDPGAVSTSVMSMARAVTDCRERAIANQEPWRIVPWKGFAELLCRPRRRRMRSHSDVHDAPPMVGKQDKHEQQATGRRRHDEEVGRHDLVHVIRQERAPGL